MHCFQSECNKIADGDAEKPGLEDMINESKRVDGGIDLLAEAGESEHILEIVHGLILNVRIGFYK